MSDPKYVSMDGRLVPYADARVHVLAPAITYGATVFEGVRGYKSGGGDECLLFRLGDHLERLAFSMKVMRFETDLEMPQVRDWVRELVRANGQRDEVHIRVLAYVAEGPNMYVTAPIGLAIASLSRPVRKEAAAGIRCAVSSWRRISDDSMPPRVKCASNYQNGRLASLQARNDGYDMPILLSASGHVAEAPGSCLFLLRDGRLVTPAVSSDILESITRDTIIRLASEHLSIDVEQREVDRSELYLAQEMFLCGTASEITPIASIDGYRVGTGGAGPVTTRVREAYARLVRGDLGHPEWLTPVYGESAAAGA